MRWIKVEKQPPPSNVFIDIWDEKNKCRISDFMFLGKWSANRIKDSMIELERTHWRYPPKSPELETSPLDDAAERFRAIACPLEEARKGNPKIKVYSSCKECSNSINLGEPTYCSEVEAILGI